MSNQLVIATHNLKKAGEMFTILNDRFPELKLKTLSDYPRAPEPEETALTYAGNAALKAEAAAARIAEWCIADDAGLEIDALDGAPGLYSKRFAGADTPFPEKIRRILGLLDGISEAKRTARFRCCVALAKAGQPTQIFEATCEGTISTRPSGRGGFGYDPIFYLPELECTMADLTASEKHRVSHRGKVLAAFADHWALLS